MKEKAIVAWSRTKDSASALALSATLNSGRYEVQELLTTVNRDYDRISIHGVTRVLIKRQAKALRIPLEKTFISEGASDMECENEFLKALKRQKDSGFFYVVFGDIFLEDLREYRERILTKAGMNGFFTLW